MSRTILMGILSDMRVWLGEPETEELYKELLAYFGLVGASNVCQALESAWKDPYNKQEIEEFIKAWLRRRRRREAEAVVAGVI